MLSWLNSGRYKGYFQGILSRRLEIMPKTRKPFDEPLTHISAGCQQLGGYLLRREAYSCLAVMHSSCGLKYSF